MIFLDTRFMVFPATLSQHAACDGHWPAACVFFIAEPSPVHRTRHGTDRNKILDDPKANG
jgi:hypothetical protein